MRKLLFILVFTFILLSNVCDAKSIKFVQISEVLHGKDGSAELLDKAIKDINQMNDIDFVVFTGDNTAGPNEEQLKSFVTEAKKLNKPFYMVVGDKDVSKSKHLEKEVYEKKLHKLLGRKSPKTLNYTFEKGNVVFIVVDGAKDFITMPNGYFNPKTLNWLNDQLNIYKDKKVVILQHFPIANKNSNEMYYTANAVDYLKMLNRHENVISVVAGHFNKNDEVSLNGVYYIVTPSLSKNCYKIIEIDEENGYQVFTSLVNMD